MRLLAALATAAATYLGLAAVTGRLPRRIVPVRRRERGAMQRWLSQAGVATTPARFVACCVIAGVAVAAIAGMVTATPVVGVVPGVVAGLAPRWWVARRRAQRLRAIQEAWPDGLRQLVTSIAAGMSLTQALRSLAERGPGPLRDAFARFPVLVRTVGVVPALELLKTELADPTSDRVIEVLILAHERGGRIVSEILADLAVATTEDVAALEQIATESLEQRINARAVFALPWAVLLTLTARPGPFRDFYQSTGGLLVVLAAAGMSLVGLWLAGRLARQPAEDRVLAATERTR